MDSIHRGNKHKPIHCHQQQAAAFLKQEIDSIIKEELKGEHLKSKLAAQLAQHSKHQQEEAAILHRIESFKAREESERDRQLQLYYERQAQKEKRVSTSKAVRQGLHRMKAKQFNSTFSNVQQRYSQIIRQDEQARLSKLPDNAHSVNHHFSFQRHSHTHKQSRLSAVRSMERELQTSKITKYLSKVEKSESRILLKEITNNQRRESGLRRKVKCLVGARQKQEQDLMGSLQSQHNQRMQAFSINKSRLLQQQHSALLTQSVLKTRATQQVSCKRRQLHQAQISNILTTYSIKQKENIMKKYRSELDLHYSHQNRQKILNRMRMQQQEEEHERRMRTLGDKIDRIRGLQEGERLDEKTVAYIASMFDKSDQDYPRILEFLRSDRRTYMEGVVRKEEERSKKMSQTLSKLNSS